jgi:hypothetical protein
MMHGVLKKRRKFKPAKKSGKPMVDRLVTITLDPGHGGEDPGAVGQGRHLRKERHAGRCQAPQGASSMPSRTCAPC